MAEPVARGQRVIHEVVFVADPALGARMRFVRPAARPLPLDEHTSPSTAEAADRLAQTQDVVDTPGSESVWEALEPDDRES